MMSALAAVFAVLAFGAMAVSSAVAAHPQFLTESKTTLSFTGEGGLAILRGGNLKVEGIIHCEQSLAHGFILHATPLADEVKILFEKKCEQEIGTSKGTCTEPIHVKSAVGELGLLNKVVALLLAPESGTEFVEVKCTNGNTKVEGAIVGIIPEKDGAGLQQYNTTRKDFLIEFKAKGLTQEPEEIELLGVKMTVSLKVSGAFGEKASEEAHSLLTVDGGGSIDTK